MLLVSCTTLCRVVVKLRAVALAMLGLRQSDLLALAGAVMVSGLCMTIWARVISGASRTRKTMAPVMPKTARVPVSLWGEVTVAGLFETVLTSEASGASRTSYSSVFSRPIRMRITVACTVLWPPLSVVRIVARYALTPVLRTTVTFAGRLTKLVVVTSMMTLAAVSEDRTTVASIVLTARVINGPLVRVSILRIGLQAVSGCTVLFTNRSLMKIRFSVVRV